MTGPFLAYPPLDVPFASACNARVHVFTLHRGKQDTGNRDGDALSPCYTLMRQVPTICASERLGAVRF